MQTETIGDVKFNLDVQSSFNVQKAEIDIKKLK